MSGFAKCEMRNVRFSKCEMQNVRFRELRNAPCEISISGANLFNPTTLLSDPEVQTARRCERAARGGASAQRVGVRTVGQPVCSGRAAGVQWAHSGRAVGVQRACSRCTVGAQGLSAPRPAAQPRTVGQREWAQRGSDGRRNTYGCFLN